MLFPINQSLFDSVAASQRQTTLDLDFSPLFFVGRAVRTSCPRPPTASQAREPDWPTGISVRSLSIPLPLLWLSDIVLRPNCDRKLKSHDSKRFSAQHNELAVEFKSLSSLFDHK